MKKLLLGFLLLTSASAFAADKVEVIYNALEGQESYLHESCKIVDTEGFFDKKATKILKKKGYIMLQEAPAAAANLLANDSSFADNTYLVPRSFISNMNYNSVNGRESITLQGVYGFQQVIAGAITISVGNINFFQYFELAGQGKKTEKLEISLKKKMAQLMPACEKK